MGGRCAHTFSLRVTEDFDKEMTHGGQGNGGVSVIYYCMTKCPQTQNNAHVLSPSFCGSGGQAQLHRLPCSGSLPRCQPGLTSLFAAQLGRSCFQAHSASHRLLDSVPPVQHSSSCHQCASQQDNEDSLLAERGTVSCNLIMDVTSHPLCQLLLVRSKSGNQSHTEGKGITQGNQ